MHRQLLVAVAIAITALSGCDRGAVRAEGPVATPTSASSTPGGAPSGPAVDWTQPAADLDLGRGVVLGDCEGDAPLLCVRRGSTPIGVIELISYPVPSTPELQRDLARGHRAALAGHVERYFESVRADRAAGCPGLRVEALPTSYVETSDGATLVRYGFSATTAEGERAERMVQYAGIRAGSLVLVVASAIDDGGCLTRDGGEFTSEELAALEPTLDALVRRSPAPGPGDAG